MSAWVAGGIGKGGKGGQRVLVAPDFAAYGAAVFEKGGSGAPGLGRGPGFVLGVGCPGVGLNATSAKNVVLLYRFGFGGLEGGGKNLFWLAGALFFPV